MAREQWRERLNAIPAAVCRPNTTMRDMVEQGIAMLKTNGPREAAQFLTTRNVPSGVIVRVLSEPQRRRLSLCPG
ncbi:hypothetical protein [Rugamonas apoptosis]|uniref:Uncharacterized protein n=1 Tax=Rugamonas apoptosis TaxID=2758570 RepID=A0A7W2IND2_9BURK|nr:hypothetical protein [Rugamonas apoptosis]MBA5690574.1 hypothetical protein [Rugamonas apoptosis]